MNHNLAALTAATTFTWLGMVVGVSLLETPLRFRALRADIEQDAEATRLGLGIGRLVFRALNTAESVLAAVIVVAVLAASPTVPVAVLTGVVAVVLIAQLAAVRPFLQQRGSRVLAGEHPPRSRAHHAYVGLEMLKVPALIALGAMALAAL
ncbi:MULTISPECIES: hypothetical protein [Streptomyces]|uniref:hypothetical protein n=1 Tax=Streptomyces lycopersici TaxID=2974589 RepID=UPI0021D0310E|nr:hypothetical protein [Streptomyces sp. NEAU-383]